MGREQDGATAPMFKGHTMYPDPLLMKPLHHRPLLSESVLLSGECPTLRYWNEGGRGWLGAVGDKSISIFRTSLSSCPSLGAWVGLYLFLLPGALGRRSIPWSSSQISDSQ